jgi:hypothetical protein
MSAETAVIADIQERRAKRKELRARAREEQYAKDLERVDLLEEEHGDDRVAVLETPSYVPGLPTVVVVKTPPAAVFNRFRSMIRKAQKNMDQMGAAQELLADSCVVYPDAETYKRMKDEWPSIHDSVGVEAIRLGEAKGKE